MPVFDFSDTPVANEHPECTYETFHSTETKASADKPIVVIDNKQKEWAHHALGMFTNPIKRTSFEFEDGDGVTSADILRIDSRFVSLFKWLGENHIKVQLSGANTPDSKHIDTYVSGGKYGVSLLGSKMDGDDVALKAKYKVKLPVSFFAVDGIWIEDYSNSRKWTGKNPGEKTDPYVFYTDYGSVYHLSEQCNYLDLSIKSIKWSQVGASRNKDGRKYHACYCAADKKTEGSTVFITDYGMNYHGKLGCSKLKRTVHKVHKSEVDGKNLCSKCKGEGT